MITQQYNDRAMAGISEDDYDTLVVHLSEQVAACIPGHGEQAHDAASDALANTWQPELTVREWLAAVGTRLDADTSRCMGV